MSASLFTAKDELMRVLDEEHAQGVIDHRAAKKAKLTPFAARLLAKEFAKCADPNGAAEAMLIAGWQGFKADWINKPQPMLSASRGASVLEDRKQRLAERISDEHRIGREGSEHSAPLGQLPQLQGNGRVH